MQLRGPFMQEHRLIERMLSVISNGISHIEAKEKADPLFVDMVVDFIQVYADRTHHGKEEDILFSELAKKPLSASDRELMYALIGDHEFARETTTALVEANTRYRNGNDSALTDIVESFRTFVNFYPVHIDKEDAVFFPAARSYFTDAEEQAILARFQEFDQQMIHEKYQSLIEEMEQAL